MKQRRKNKRTKERMTKRKEGRKKERKKEREKERKKEKKKEGSYKQLKLDLETENWLKAEILKFGGRAATTFARRNLKIENFSWRQCALGWKSARNTSFRC